MIKHTQHFDRNEIEFGSDPADPLSLATNTPPILSDIPGQAVPAGTLLSLAVSATDTDRPPQKLTFSLVPPVPLGAAIDPATGVFTWRPAQAQALNSYHITVRVTDSGTPNRSASRTFIVTVGQHPLAPRIATVSVSADGATIHWNAIIGRTYRVQFKNSLVDPDWANLEGDVTADFEVVSKADVPAGLRQERYYRVLLIE